MTLCRLGTVAKEIGFISGAIQLYPFSMLLRDRYVIVIIFYMCTVSSFVVVSLSLFSHNAGLLAFYLLLVLVYLVGIGAYAHRVWLTISKGGPMHEVLKMLSIAMAIHFSAAILMLVHLWR